MKFVLCLVFMFTMFSCGEDVDEVASYRIDGQEVECPGAMVAESNGTYKTCDWLCADYQENEDKHVRFTFLRDTKNDDWELFSESVSDNSHCD